MIKEYTLDPIKIDKFEERRKKREKFKEKKPIRILLFLIGALVSLISVLYLYYNKGDLNKNSVEVFIGIFSLTLVVLLFVWTPIIIYCKLSYGLGGFPSFCRKGETLVLYEDRIINSYSFVGKDGKEMYVENEIKYLDIKDIILDIVFKNLYVICKVDQAIYDSGRTTLYSKKTFGRESFVFYLYFDNNKDFSKTLSVRSGVKIKLYNRNNRRRRLTTINIDSTRLKF